MTDTTLDTTITTINTSITPLNTTVVPLNSAALNHTTVMATVTTENVTKPYTSSSQLSGAEFTTPTFPPNTTLFNFLIPSQSTLHLNATAPPLNTTQHTTTITKTSNDTTLAHTTESPININESDTTQPLVNTTEFNTTAIPYDTTQLLNNSTLETTDAETDTTTYTPQVSTTINTLNFTTFFPNVTYSNITDPLLNTTQSNTTAFTLNTTHVPLNVTSSNGTDVIRSINTTESSNSTSEYSTTHVPLNVTDVNRSTNTTESSNSTSEYSTTHVPLNVTDVNRSTNTTESSNSTSEYSTTHVPLNVTDVNRSINTTESSNSTSEYSTTHVPLNVTDVNRSTNTTESSNSTSEYSTTHVPLNVTDVNRSINTTESSNSTSEYSTTHVPLNVTSSNGTDVNRSINTTETSNSTSEYSTTHVPLNVTYVNQSINTTETSNSTSEYSTTHVPLNETSLNGTDVNRSINTTETSNSTSQFNTTVSPAVNTTQFHFTNTTQIHTTTFPSTENITSGPIESTSKRVTTDTTQSNDTIEIVSTENTISNTTTTFSPIPNNIPTNATIISIVTNSSTAPTTSLPAILPSSPQNSSSSTTAAPIITPPPTTNRSDTTAVTTRPAVPAVPTTPFINPTTTSEATTKSPDTVASNLLNQTQNVASLNSTQVNQLVNQLENLLSAPNISLDLGRTVLSVINNFLNSSTDSLAESSNRLIKAVDNLALKLVIRDQTENLVFDSLALTVTKVDGTNFGATSFSIVDPLNPQVTKGFQRQVRAVESSSLMGKITLPASLTESLTPEQQKIASRAQFTFFQKSTFFQDKNLNHMLNSHILGSSVANLSIKNLRENVEFTLRNKQPVAGNYVASCVFWDFDQNGGSGGWNANGCYVKNSSTENETICSCNHLTSFAVLLDISRQGINDPVQAKILTFITYIGCGVSAIFLSVTLLTYLAFDKIRRDIPSKILIHLCFALLLLNLVFLLDSWLALYPNAVGLCISTAFFLHYFLLVCFTWMGLEALHMYLAIVKVFNNFMSRYMLKFSLAGWGIPLVVVIIVIAVNKDNYGLISYGKFSDGTTEDFCWLKNDIAFYVAVVAYFCIIFVLNLAMFVVVMVHLRRIKRQNPHNNQYRSGLQDLRSIAGLTFLLGLTWGFAFFAWGPVNLAFMYLFAITNSLQGFFIFVFHCALKETVRKQWRMYLCCGRLRLAENSEWSRTATQSNNKKSSILTAVTSNSGTPSAPRSSVSSNESVPSQGIGSPIDDSLIMSGEVNDDVLLNEINSQLGPRLRSV
ncbi:adhesion G-protein coupled receptor G2 [Pseudorasbora parva]|uniref:adhesion G-protein coupled receptor G2 n=1 Tax=Pseudorasbora parva TaxID=51549 RepID=UPI00351F51FC